MVMNGVSGENRLFIVAVTGSLLLHLAVLWLGRGLIASDNERSITPHYSAIAVALVPARSLSERVVVPRRSRSGEMAGSHLSPQAEPAVPDAMDTPVLSTPVATESLGGEDAGEVSESAAQGGGAVDAGARDRYLAAVLAHIEAHKFYPQPARRRGLQGRVEVHFTLDARGAISDLDVSGSNALFVEAARAAVRGAMPLPAAPSREGFPLTVRYQMIFRLQ